MFKKSILFLSLISILTASSYEEWLKSQNSEYSTYKKSMDEEFSDMLKKDWEAFKAMSTPSPYIKPKPTDIPAVKEEVVLPKKEIIDSPKIKFKPIIKEKVIPAKVIPVVKKYHNFKTANFDFYGENISIQYDKKISFNLGKINKTIISKYWDKVSNSDFKKLISQINKQSSNLSLNDWGKYQLIYKLGLKIYDNPNSANLFTWFVLVKNNFDTKVGYSKNNIYLLSTMKHSLYQIAFFNLNKKKYYILTPNGRVGKIGNVYTYSGDYPKAKKQLSFEIKKDIKLYQNIKQKKLSFKYNNKTYDINTQYSQELVNFYKSFPQSDYNIYFSTKNSPSLSNSLVKSLQPYIVGKSEIEAVNFLLRFTQKSFAYKTDQKQFDYEKVMFPEETIYYPYSDCEDRSIMFSYLVKSLLNLDVVGVKYQDHLATAVAFSSNISGDGFVYKNKKYTISDPTYINANSGMTMPTYKNSKFKIIALK
ncbi:MAG: hypothetical protein U9Q20_06905 [Campylobacterota bacterium]|nr:hypothetical protein [Campylobacterota bacterium]